MEQEITQSLRKKLVILLRNYNTAFGPEVISKGGLSTAIVLLAHLDHIDSQQMSEYLSKFIAVRLLSL